jgi:hypothetical protein
MRLPRMTTRLWMLVVVAAILFLPLFLAIAWFLSPEQVRLRALIDDYNVRAEHHAALEREASRLSEISETSHAIVMRHGHATHAPVAQRPELVPRYLELAKYYGALRRKYEEAALHPRLPVEPDPPQP